MRLRRVHPAVIEKERQERREREWEESRLPAYAPPPPPPGYEREPKRPPETLPRGSYTL